MYLGEVFSLFCFKSYFEILAFLAKKAEILAKKVIFFGFFGQTFQK